MIEERFVLCTRTMKVWYYMSTLTCVVRGPKYEFSSDWGSNSVKRGEKEVIWGSESNPLKWAIPKQSWYIYMYFV